MPGILILMHNPANVKMCAKIAESFLRNHAFNSKIIAPVDFVTPGVDQQHMPEKIVKLIPTDNEIRIIFFEANLGYPAHESLSTPTVEVLKFLIQSCPEATFILKSHTNKAIQNAQDILQEEKISSERIFPDGGPLKMSDTLKQVMCEAFNEQRSKITLR